MATDSPCIVGVLGLGGASQQSGHIMPTTHAHYRKTIISKILNGNVNGNGKDLSMAGNGNGKDLDKADNGNGMTN